MSSRSRNQSLKLTNSLYLLSFLFFSLFIKSSLYAMDGSSGCGPGWYAFKNNSLVSSALRATTNGILFPIYTLGMTVGTSNCTKHSIVLKEKQTLHFLTMSFYEIKSDIARGHGSYVKSLGQTLGCQSQALDSFSNTMKESYKVLYSTEEINPSNTLLEVYKAILQKPNLARQCSFQIG